MYAVTVDVGAVSNADSVRVDVKIVVVVGRPGLVIVLVGVYVVIKMLCDKGHCQRKCRTLYVWTIRTPSVTVVVERETAFPMTTEPRIRS